MAESNMNELHGEKIKESKYYRAYCNRCGTPMRVKEPFDEDNKPIIFYCTECGGGKHIGCSSPPSPLDDPDEHSSSWKIASGIDD